MKVLIPVDIAHPHPDLIDHLQWLLPINGDNITLLYVKEILPSYERLIETTADFPEDWTHQIDKKVNEMFAPMKASLEKNGASVSCEIVSGPPEHMIATIARDEHADLTVVSPGQRSVVEKFFLGSTSAGVFKLAPGTVLLLRDTPAHNQLRHVVFGVDGTETALHAMKTAVEQFRLAERKIKATVLYAVSIPAMVQMLSPAEIVVAVEKNMEMEGETIIAEALKVLKDLGISDAQPRLVVGEPAAEIIRFSQQSDVQLIVIGAQGHSLVEHLLMGSVAQRIITHAGCSTAIVKPPRKK